MIILLFLLEDKKGVDIQNVLDGHSGDLQSPKNYVLVCN